MSLGTRQTKQEEMFIPTANLAKGPGQDLGMVVRCDESQWVRILSSPFFVFGWRIIFGIFFHCRYHLIHPLLDFADLGMDLFDEIVLNPGKFLDSFALLTKLVEKSVLLG
jgi:hypothetical protein